MGSATQIKVIFATLQTHTHTHKCKKKKKQKETVLALHTEL